MSKMGELAIELDEELHPTLGEQILCSCCAGSNGQCGGYGTVAINDRSGLIHLKAHDWTGEGTVMLTSKQALQMAMLLQEAALDVRARR